MNWLTRLFHVADKVQPVSVTDANFHAEVLQSELPVLVDFWSPGCGPCGQLAPIVVDLATEFEGRLKVVEVNVVDAQKIARRYGVMATPTVLYFKKGGMVDKVVGFRGSLYHREIVENSLIDMPTASASASAPATTSA